jgi:hypothetical protein
MSVLTKIHVLYIMVYKYMHIKLYSRILVTLFVLFRMKAYADTHYAYRCITKNCITNHARIKRPSLLIELSCLFFAVHATELSEAQTK